MESMLVTGGGAVLLSRFHMAQAVLALTVTLGLLAACQSAPTSTDDETPPSLSADGTASSDAQDRTLTLAFAGDVHFEGGLAGLLDDPDATLGPMSRHLAAADLAMVNLESAVAEGGSPTAKELEEGPHRYWFGAPTTALEVLARSGVDVVTVANNHGVDFGPEGLEETLAAVEESPVAVVGVGRDSDEAFAPHRVDVAGTQVAVFGADASRAESRDSIWSAGDDAGLAAARDPSRLLAAVAQANESSDLVVVYLHWGRAAQRCPTRGQRTLAQSLAEAGADVVVGSHAHVLLGAGMLDDTYVSYGLGDFVWYHGRRPDTGVLTLTVTGGQVVGHRLQPARIPTAGGRPRPVTGAAGVAAVSQWERLAGCAELAPVGGGELPAYAAKVTDLGPAMRRRISNSLDAATCPVLAADLRHLTLPYVGFDGLAHTGEMLVHHDHAQDVVQVFEELYDARWPIRRMRLASDHGGNDDRSMAHDNTSAHNCRRVAGQANWSAHAYGAAIDLNPVENPYVTTGGVLPPAGRAFAAVDRSPGADLAPGVIGEGDVVTRAFARIGWTWGGTWAQPDYQHFFAPTPP